MECMLVEVILNTMGVGVGVEAGALLVAEEVGTTYPLLGLSTWVLLDGTTTTI